MAGHANPWAAGRSCASRQGQNLAVKFKGVLGITGKKKENQKQNRKPRRSRTDGQNVPGKNRGIALEPGSGSVPRRPVGSSPDASGQESCVSVLLCSVTLSAEERFACSARVPLF